VAFVRVARDRRVPELHELARRRAAGPEPLPEQEQGHHHHGVIVALPALHAVHRQTLQVLILLPRSQAQQ